MDVVDILGLVGTAGLIAFYIPQLISVWRAPRLRGFNRAAWVAVAVGSAALLTQLILLHAWTGALAQAVAMAAAAETLRQIARKQR